MLEIAVISLIVIVAVVLFRQRPKKPPTGPDQPVAFVCPHCNEKDCHCERRS